MNTTNLNELFSTEERVKTLKYIIYLEKPFTITETAKELDLNKGFISNYFKNLQNNELLKRKENEFSVKQNSKVKGIRILFNLEKIDEEIFKKYEFVEAAGLYGSAAKGTNTKSSDTDIWIKTEPTTEEKQSKLTADLRKNIKNVKPLLLNNEKIKKIKEEDPIFYHSLYFGSILIYGEIDEIQPE